MINMDKLWCLQWSGTQKCWHVDYLSSVMKGDLDRLCSDGDLNDWVTMAVSFDSLELNLLSEKIDEIRKKGAVANG